MTQIAQPSDVPGMGRRQFMNLLTFGSAAGVAAGALYPFVKYFVPASTGGGGGGVTAKDALGNDVIVSEYLETHPAGDRSLVQGLKGDPTYLIVENDGTLANYGLNAVCTHLGCVVPWNEAEDKFMCPCHGSQYNAQGKVVRGPAPLSLALAHADINDDKVSLTTWTETDFRTDKEPWWT
ncbi:MAG: cytochrome b6-f complex iron-sulfur subunit [Microcoleaceae cyanobacterium]